MFDLLCIVWSETVTIFYHGCQAILSIRLTLTALMRCLVSCTSFDSSEVQLHRHDPEQSYMRCGSNTFHLNRVLVVNRKIFKVGNAVFFVVGQFILQSSL